MQRTLVISDIHGCYDELNQLLELVKYSPSVDKLVLLGDYCDRGFNSRKVIEQVKLLVEEWGVIALRGNHDQMFKDAIEKDEDQIWIQNGGLGTIESYVGSEFIESGYWYGEYVKAKELIKKYYSHHIEFIKSLPVYYEDDKHIYVHAGLNPLYENWKEQPTENFLWIRNLFLDNPTTVNKTVVFGHTPTIHLQDTEDVWFGKGKIGVDGGCVFGFQLNCLEINEEGYKTYHVEKELKCEIYWK